MILSTKKKSFEMEKEPAQSRVTATVVAGPWNHSHPHCCRPVIVLIVNCLVFFYFLSSYPHCHCFHPVMLIVNCILSCFPLTFVSIGKSSPSKTPNTGAQPYVIRTIVIVIIILDYGSLSFSASAHDNRDNSNREREIPSANPR